MYEEKEIDLDDLVLDKNNYRIDFERYNTIEKVIERLYIDENIIGMIEGIVSFPGLYPHEKLIVLPAGNDKYRVVEGNRRVLAAKSILERIDIPEKYKQGVKTLASKLTDTTKNSLTKIGCVVYDLNDKQYLKIMASKHSSISYERWGQISQWHFYKDLYDLNGQDIDKTAEDLGKIKAEVMNYIRYYNLLRYIRSLDYWDQKGLRDQIESNTLKATKFTRPLGFAAVRNALGINFNESMDILPPSEDLNEFNEVLCKYAEATLILDKSDDDYIYTRSDEKDVVELIEQWKMASAATNGKMKYESRPNQINTVGDHQEGKKDQEQTKAKPSGKNQKPPVTRTRKPAKYFEDLKCTVEDQRLSRLTQELVELSKSNRMDKFPASATILIRALLESALYYLVDSKGRTGDYKKSLENERDGKKSYRNDGLKSLLSYVIKNSEVLFGNENSRNAKKALEQIKSVHLGYLNSIVHKSWLDPTSSKIEGIAGDTRELLRAILTGKA